MNIGKSDIDLDQDKPLSELVEAVSHEYTNKLIYLLYMFKKFDSEVYLALLALFDGNLEAAAKFMAKPHKPFEGKNLYEVYEIGKREEIIAYIGGLCEGIFS